ncbi:MAG: Uma2 family endonuclease [Microcystis sp. M53603_WE2]|jgi:Uma2 family endonuclease|uniref:Uma2 family endonuclease n=1 Tax=unclassified Microcystis TaxID=2643300 RepID=UPI0022CCC744|nr:MULTISPECIES: Uma2 family endonuclease [unclassified Microcystis]MCZ8362960.1 Uma2 family endonuclease [Microcystis sp. LE19-251.1A]MDJ0524442.1 Uma2 family endonuclease [Microcystis sp. M53600_WE12]MDJ0566345.1 Uma2 family endonuclease [Microcystis sp. M49629_WE12]MCZ8025290.1 Uma2 family endonuclease [Microcystis sp. LE19-10.1B]MDJ0541585.1 Uma2 family endonuclease [Microcystis sp. M53603_WE2]
MTTFPIIDNNEFCADEVKFPPRDIWSEEPSLESYAHLQQILILLQCLEWLWQERNDYFAAANLTIYYSPNQKKSEYFRGPDFFVVLGTERRLDRKSWVVWGEGGKYPDVIVEILSPSTAKIDRGEKKQIYQDIFRTPDYFWFDPETLELQGFRLMEGQYQAIEPTDRGWLWSDLLGLFLGIYQQQLRYFNREGELIPTPAEVAKQERQEKVLALQQIEQLKSLLRELGADLEGI